MPLKAYRKASVAYVAADMYQDTFAIKPILIEPDPEPVTMWRLITNIGKGIKSVTASSSTAGLLIPTLFILAGAFIIYQQVQPVITQKIKESAGYYNQGTTALVQESYIPTRMQYVSNPGANYFKNLTDAAFGKHILVEDLLSQKYSGTLYLTIPSLGFNRLPITANVDSGNKQIYDQVLNHSLAHFKGTSLPFSDTDNNIVIYGHSASGSYNPTPTDVLAAFSFLSELKVGDTITLEMDGTKYDYRMTRSKIVDPDDTSIITGTPGKKTLTLFTCYPNGNSDKRYVAVATPV